MRENEKVESWSLKALERVAMEAVIFARAYYEPTSKAPPLASMTIKIASIG